MTCLITGATGFVGKSLCILLEQNKYLIKLSDQRLSILDWSHELLTIDTVIHLAARVHIIKDRSTNPLSDFRNVNVDGTLNLARQAAAAGVKRFIFLSSIKVNGEFTLPNQPFKANEANPQDPYGISKHEAEIGLRDIAAETGMEVVIIRPPLIYGAGVKANFASLSRIVKAGMPLPLGSVINNRRSFVSLQNLIDLIITCIDHPKAANQTFLVSDDDDVSTSELIRKIAKAQNVPTRLFPVPIIFLKSLAKVFGKLEIEQRLLGNLQVDITKNKTLLGWQPPYTLEEGLGMMVDES